VPYHSLEYIPWQELHSVGEPYQNQGHILPRVYWSASRKAKFDYHLHTEDDVFRYCVINNFTFPESTTDGNPLFVVKDWQNSELALDLQNYIPIWVSALEYCPILAEYGLISTTRMTVQ